jgi:hypothetical protein
MQASLSFGDTQRRTMRRVIHRQASVGYGRQHLIQSSVQRYLSVRVDFAVRILIHLHFDAPAHAQASHLSCNRCFVAEVVVQVPFPGYSWL